VTVDGKDPASTEEALDRRQTYEQRRAEMRARSEARNEAIRRSLEPLAPGERPGVITVSAVVATFSAICFWVSAGIALFGDITVAGVRQPNPTFLILVAALLSWMAFGLWKSRYGATLAFQGFMVFVILTCSLGLVLATSWIQAISCLLIVAGAGYLFYRLVRVMARMQAPAAGTEE